MCCASRSLPLAPTDCFTNRNTFVYIGSPPQWSDYSAVSSPQCLGTLDCHHFLLFDGSEKEPGKPSKEEAKGKEGADDQPLVFCPRLEMPPGFLVCYFGPGPTSFISPVYDQRDHISLSSPNGPQFNLSEPCARTHPSLWSPLEVRPSPTSFFSTVFLMGVCLASGPILLGGGGHSSCVIRPLTPWTCEGI